MSDLYSTPCPWCKSELKISSREFADSKYTEIVCDSCGAQLEIEAEYAISGVFVSSAICVGNGRSHDWTDWKPFFELEYRNCMRCPACEHRVPVKEEAK